MWEGLRMCLKCLYPEVPHHRKERKHLCCISLLRYIGVAGGDEKQETGSALSQWSPQPPTIVHHLLRLGFHFKQESTNLSRSPKIAKHLPYKCCFKC